jgi:nicotinamidase-related amidase
MGLSRPQSLNGTIARQSGKPSGVAMQRMPTLLLIDVQQAFDRPDWGTRNNLDAEERIVNLLAHWRLAGAPIIHVRHRSAAADGRFRGEGLQFKPEAVPQDGEPVVEKSVNSAFIGTDLEQRLRAADTHEVVIAGLTTDHCCSTTARMAGNMGFTTYVVADAMATFARRAPDGGLIDAETIHRTALASLMDEFATVIDSERARSLIERGR